MIRRLEMVANSAATVKFHGDIHMISRCVAEGKQVGANGDISRKMQVTECRQSPWWKRLIPLAPLVFAAGLNLCLNLAQHYRAKYDTDNFENRAMRPRELNLN
jgi:hypothetical protein